MIKKVIKYEKKVIIMDDFFVPTYLSPVDYLFRGIQYGPLRRADSLFLPGTKDPQQAPVSRTDMAD